MNHQDSFGNGIGGGEVLNLLKPFDLPQESPYLNNELIKQYALIPLVLAIIAALFIFMAVKSIMAFKGRRSHHNRGMHRELDFASSVRSMDSMILKSNRFLGKITNIVERTIFKSQHSIREEMDYTLARAGVMVPGRYRYMTYPEFNAIIVLINAVTIVSFALVGLFVSMAIGLSMIAVMLIGTTILPRQILTSIVAGKDNEIRHNFSDFYLMLHYAILNHGKTQLSQTVMSYMKTTDSAEMKRLANTCIEHWDTNGEYSGCIKIAREYRDIAEIGKLMRLIRQANESGDVKQELLNFREEVISYKKYELEQFTNKLITKAKFSFNILIILTIQAVISATMIYFSDLGVIKTFLPG